jgi:hypothetical protein
MCSVAINCTVDAFIKFKVNLAHASAKAYFFNSSPWHLPTSSASLSAELSALSASSSTIASMGMFDEVRFESDLPTPVGLPARLAHAFKIYVHSSGLQTKDLECLLDVYVVKANGSLVVNSRTWGDASDKFSSAEEFTDFHGRLECHGIFTTDSLQETVSESFYVKYILKFTDGFLVKVEVAEVTLLEGMSVLDLKHDPALKIFKSTKPTQ